MDHRSRWLLALVLLAGIAVLLGRSCGHDDPPVPSAGPTSSPAAITDGDNLESAQATAAQALAIQRQQALSAAVDTLHRYLAALNGEDLAKADAYWVNDSPPAQSSEADLRALKGLRALRIENRTPKPLDSEAIPAALEIPVELRASLDDAPSRYYRGWYRLRSLDPVNGDWEITSASVNAEARR